MLNIIVTLFVLLVWPHEVEEWFNSFLVQRLVQRLVETLDAKHANMNSSLYDYTQTALDQTVYTLHSGQQNLRRNILCLYSSYNYTIERKQKYQGFKTWLDCNQQTRGD